MKKKCGHCHIEKELSEFSKNRSAKSGYGSYCKKCEKEYREKHREERAALWKEYSAKHREALRIKDRFRYKLNPEKEKARHKEYKSRSEVREHNRSWWREYTVKRIHSDELYAFRLWIVRETRRAATSKNGHVNPRLLPLLGCSGKALWEHLLETWEKNYGNEWNGEKYQIDHIVPFATARTIEGMGKLAHYTNTQMLTPEDNRKKGASNNSVSSKNKV